MNGTISFEPKTRAERLSAVLAASLTAPATVGYLSLLVGWSQRVALAVIVLISAWLVFASLIRLLLRGDTDFYILTGTVSGAALGWMYHLLG
ncbi:MAG: hypothetical protein U5J64_02455 [Halobacteriales archaeon]|nr:hypothetical protein [Halobacteriales archaeon]